MSPYSASDNPFELQQTMQGLVQGGRVWIGFSGGLDSTVLLHNLGALREGWPELELCAVHVNHGLSVDSADWASHCRDICRSWGIPLAVLAVDASARAGESPEARARQQRYAALRALLGPGAYLCTAHHQDDQAETVLLNLIRGSGVAGLAGMHQARTVHGLNLLRPLLDFPRADLHAYALRHGLRWIEDPSNSDTRFQRNFVRHRVLNKLDRERPGSSAVIARAARNLQDAADCLQELAETDLRECSVASRLRISALLSLSLPRQRNLLLTWLRERQLPIPHTRQLNELLRQLRDAREAAMVEVKWPGAQLRRYRDLLYAMAGTETVESDWHGQWNLLESLQLPGGQLQAQACRGIGLRAASCPGNTLQVRYRKGGECCEPAGRGHRHSLKKLFQEAGIPHWMRARVPLLYVEDQLAGVADLFVCESFQAGPGETGWKINWSDH